MANRQRMDMPEDPRIDLILERWEDLRQKGAEVSVEELCEEHPDLLDVVRKHIQALREMEWLDASGTNGREKDDLEPVPPTLGRYRLDILIGAGGYGQVWKGFDPELQRTVAIKIPRSGHLSSTERTAQFLDEARKVAQLRPPGIVSVHDVGCDGDYCYIVSDFIDGGNLAELPERLLWQDAVSLVVKIADALQHAHAKGFIHRDIKLANILLDTNGSPYLTDFGIAVTEEELLENKTVTAGTLAFMSPEQVDGRPIDSRTDIYSLGVVLYELLVGHRPFVAADSVDLRRAILSEKPAFPDSTKVPLRLKTICLKALAKKPQDRYATATQFANELKALYEPRQKRLRLWSVIGAVLLASAVIVGLVTKQYQNKSQLTPKTDAVANAKPSLPQESKLLPGIKPAESEPLNRETQTVNPNARLSIPTETNKSKASAKAIRNPLATFTQIDISRQANYSWLPDYLPGAPTGNVTLGGIPFNIASNAAGNQGWSAQYAGDDSDGHKSITISVNVYGVTDVYTLINTIYGRPGPTSYAWLTFTGSNGATYTKQLVGNIDIRDYCNADLTNSINETTTINVLKCPKTNNNIEGRLDMQHIVLPDEFASQTLSTITLVDNGAWGFQRVVLDGVTVAVVSEARTLRNEHHPVSSKNAIAKEPLPENR
jgi:serine/threonine protein kinase